MGLKNWLFIQKFRFDMAVVFLSIINFGLLMIANTDNLAIIGIKITLFVLILFVLSAFVGMWLLGFILDKLRLPHVIFHAAASRNPIFMETLDVLKKIDENLSGPIISKKVEEKSDKIVKTSNFKKWLVIQKFRFDQSIAILSLINFGLLVMAESDKLSVWFNIKSTPFVIFIFVILSLMSVWFLGVILDMIRYPHIKYEIESKRNEIHMEMLEITKRIEEKLK